MQTVLAHPWIVITGIMAVLIWFEEARGSDVDHRGNDDVLTNLGLYGTSLALLAAMALVVAPTSIRKHPLVEEFGLASWLELPWLGGLACFFVVDSCLGYWLHRASHNVPFLWRLHMVHHAARHLDATTGVRHHPFEVVPAVAVQLTGVAICGATPDQVALVALANTIWAVATHAAVRTTPTHFPRALRWLTSPAFHRVHHSSNRHQSDSNYGNTLTIWDYLFRTAKEPAREAVLTLGVAGYRPEPRVMAQLLLPFRKLETNPTWVEADGS
jgi:sterol desaturase/sphingolipid hydroxylase (fatty acid hydroxylase superfamily)